MKPFRFTALLVAIALAWAGFASSSFAFHTTDMAPMAAEHHMAMDDTATMPDCPSHKAGTMKMDATKCAVACFGLATTVAYEPLLHLPKTQAFAEQVLSYQQALVSRIAGVPTPPPDFA